MQTTGGAGVGESGDGDAQVVVAVFGGQPAAEAAAQDLRGHGVDEARIAIVSSAASPESLLPLGGSGGETADLEAQLVGLGVPSGQARFYERAVRAGEILLAVVAGGQAPRVRDALRARGGRDVESQGAELARGGAGRDDAAVSAPADITTRWEDVVSRYEMLWGQHYGAEGGDWASYEPIYRYAWDIANQPAYRGRAWEAVEPSLRREWEAQSPGGAWQDVAGPMRDVWEDVAADAQTGYEGGASRRTERPLEGE